MDPDESADQEAEGGHDKATKVLASLMPPVVDEGRSVDPHEREEGAKVERLGTDLVGATAQSRGEKFKDGGSGKCKSANDQDVVAGNVAFGFDRAEECFR